MFMLLTSDDMTCKVLLGINALRGLPGVIKTPTIRGNRLITRRIFSSSIGNMEVIGQLV